MTQVPPPEGGAAPAPPEAESSAVAASASKGEEGGGEGDDTAVTATQSASKGTAVPGGIVDAAKNGDSSAKTKSEGGEPGEKKSDKDAEAEEDKEERDRAARAVAEAAASASASYVPTPSVLNSPTPGPLLDQVDGPRLSTYQKSDQLYVARSVPIPLRGKTDVPIHVSVAGSVVEYKIESDGYDVAFGISAEREDGSVAVRPLGRVDSHLAPVTGKFLVGSVPCALVFRFNNEYSWFREKKISYHITVAPPSVECVIEGRRRRAKGALRVVLEDKRSAEGRLDRAGTQRASLESSIHRLEKELAEKRKSLDVAEKEERWLSSRVAVREAQVEGLERRLRHGWDDEDGDGGGREVDPDSAPAVVGGGDPAGVDGSDGVADGDGDGQADGEAVENGEGRGGAGGSNSDDEEDEDEEGEDNRNEEGKHEF